MKMSLTNRCSQCDCLADHDVRQKYNPMEIQQLARLLIRLIGLMTALQAVPGILTAAFSTFYMRASTGETGVFWIYSSGATLSLAFGLLLIFRAHKIAVVFSK